MEKYFYDLKINERFENALPPLKQSQKDALEADILEHGCVFPIIIWNGTIIDGHQRYIICKKHGLPFSVTELAFKSEADALLCVLKSHFSRRNLLPFQRAEIVLSFEEMCQDRNSVNSADMWYRLRALEGAKDEEVHDFLNATRSSGLSISLDRVIKKNGHINAVVAAFTAYRDLGRDEYTRMLIMLNRTWAGENWSLNKYMLSGMTLFLKMNEIKSPAFERTFCGVTYPEIQEIATRFHGMPKAGAFAASLSEIYKYNYRKVVGQKRLLEDS